MNKEKIITRLQEIEEVLNNQPVTKGYLTKNEWIMEEAATKELMEERKYLRSKLQSLCM